MYDHDLSIGLLYWRIYCTGVQVLIDFSPIVAGFVIGAIRPFTVLTGTHHAVRAIVSQQLATYGYTTIGAMNYMSTMHRPLHHLLFILY